MEKENEILNIVNDTEKREKLKKIINDGIKIYREIEDIKLSLKDIIDDSAKSLKIKKSLLSKVIKAGYKKTIAIDYFENEKFKIELIETLLDMAQGKRKE